MPDTLTTAPTQDLLSGGTSSKVKRLWIWGPTPNTTAKKDIAAILKGSNVLCKYLPAVPGELPMADAEDVVLAAGPGPLAELKRWGLVPKNLSVAALLGRNIKLPSGASVICTYSFDMVNIDYRTYVEVRCSLRLAHRLLLTGSIRPPALDFKWVPDLTEFMAGLEKKVLLAGGGMVDAAIDLETTGLVAYDPNTWVVTCQVSYDKVSSHVLRFSAEFQPTPVGDSTNPASLRAMRIWGQLRALFTHPKVKLKGANLKYDCNWFWEKWGLRPENFSMDTLLVGSLLDENRSNSLKTHSYEYTNYGGYELGLTSQYDIASPQDIPDDVLLPYCGYDTTVCLEVADSQRAAIVKPLPVTLSGKPDSINGLPMLLNFYLKILHPAVRAYEEVEQVGLLVDVDYYTKFGDELRAGMAEVEAEAFRLISGRTKAAFSDKKLTLGRAAILEDYFFTDRGLNLKPVMFTAKPDKNGKPRASTATEHFMKFEQVPEAARMVALVKAYKDYSKTLQTYVDGFLAHLRYDNRFHASFSLYKGAGEGTDKDGGADTGRISITAPALQTVPKHTKWAKPLRRAYVAPPGYCMCNIDYSQGELRIAACLAEEPVMLDAYLKGLDLHAVTGSGLAGLDFETFMSYKDCGDPEKEEIYERNRQNGKPANFGLLYGMSAEGYRVYAESSYGVVMSSAEAEEAREKFFTTYAMLRPWHERYKAFAKQHGYIHSPLGRVRHLPLIRSPFGDVRSKAERNAVNSPVQGTLSDMSLWATSIMHKRGLTKKAPVVLMVHDALTFYLPEDNWEYYAREYRAIMENLPFEQVGWKPQVPFTCDIEIGPNLKELKKVKLAA